MNKLSWLLAGIAIATAVFVLILASPGARAWQSGDTYGGGDWTIDEPTILADEAVAVSGNIAIKSGGSLTMYFAGISMNLAADGGYAINVESGGSLYVYDSYITSSSSANHYKFSVYGGLDINQSDISEMWGDTTQYVWAGGIQIYKGGAQVRNSYIYNGKTGGLYIENVSADIYNCDIYSNGGSSTTTSYSYGVFMSGATTTTTKLTSSRIYSNTLTSGSSYGCGVYSAFQTKTDIIQDNEIYDNGFSTGTTNEGFQLYLYMSGPTVKYNNIYNGRYGLYAFNSTATIQEVDFSHYVRPNTVYMAYGTNSTLTFDTCTFTTTYMMTTVVGIYSTGPSFNSSAFLTVKNCYFDFQSTGSYTKYFIYSYYTYADIVDSKFIGRYGASVYGIYSYASSAYSGSLNITNSAFNISETTSTTYMIYGYYCPVNITGSTFDLYNTSLSSGNVYMVYNRYYSTINVTSSSMSIIQPTPTGTRSSPYYYMLYSMSYSPINIKSSTLTMLAWGTGTYPRYAYFYMIYATSYCNITIVSSGIDLTLPSMGQYAYPYMFYFTTYTPLIVVDSEIEYSVNISTSSAYLFYAPASSPMQFADSTVRVHNTTTGYLYGFYTSSTNGNITFDHSNLIFSDLKTNTYSYFMQCYYVTFNLVNHSQYLIINSSNLTSGYHYTYCAYIYYGSVFVDNSTVYFELASVGSSNYFYGFYLYNYGQSGKTMRMTNSTFWVNSYNGNYGGWLFQPYYGTYCYFSHCYINITSRSAGNTIWYCMAQDNNNRQQLAIENCTVEYSTLIPADIRGGIIFNYMYYMDLYVNDTTIVQQNLAGLYPFNFAYYLYYARVEFINSDISIVYGNGNGTRSALECQPFYNIYNVYILNFTNTKFKVSIVNDPAVLKTLYFYYYASEVMTLRNSRMVWDISAPNSLVYMMDFSTASTPRPTLNELKLLDGSALEMTVNAKNCTVRMVSIISGGGLKSFAAKDSSVTLTLNQPSTADSAAISFDEARDLTFKGLTINVNGPPLAVDPGRTTRVAGFKLSKSAIVLDEVTVKGNGLGRCIGIWCDLGSTPEIKNSKVTGAYIGFMSTLFSQPTIYKCQVSDCPVGIMLDLSGNATLVETQITSGGLTGVTGVLMTDESWINLVRTTISTTTDIDLDGASTAWLLECTPTRPVVKFRDQRSVIMINWWQELWVTWQNDVSIPNANVVMADALGKETLRAVTNQDGIVPNFTVTEYTETGLGKTSLSPYKVTVTVGAFSGQDSIATQKSQKSQIKVMDDILPQISIATPQDNLFQNFPTLLLAGTASDVGSGIDKLRFSYDGVTQEEILASAAWTHVMDVPEGFHVFTVTVMDIAGNEASQSFNLTIDLTRPFITVDSPADGSLGNQIGVELRGRVEPLSVLTINRRPVEVASDGSFVFTARLIEGKNLFSLAARDRAGNTNASAWTLYLDITPPPLVLAAPVDGLLTNLSVVQVLGKTEPGASAELNGEPLATGPDGSFSVQYTLEPGVNTITVVARDLAGNTASQLRTVVLDNDLNLVVLSPTDNLATNQVTILVRGTTDTDVLLRLNDGLVTVEPDGNFSVTFTLSEGVNELVFSAQDRAGNSRLLTRRAVLDTSRPSLELFSPVDGALLRSRDVTVNGTCEPGMTLTVNGESVDTGTGVFSKTLTLPEGSGLLTIEGRDAAGNTVSAQLAVVIDLTAPSLEIVEPAGGFRTRDYSVVVMGLTEPGAFVTVNGQPVTVDSFGKFSTTVAIQKGKNDIRVAAGDSAGNSVGKTVSVTGTSAVSQPAPNNWWWTVFGLVIALCVMIPLTWLLVTVAGRRGRPKEGSQ